MNTLENCFITDPKGSNGACAKFVIDTPSDPFVFHNIMTDGMDYTLHFWIRTDEGCSGSISAPNSIFQVTGPDWRECGCTFVANSADLSLFFGLPDGVSSISYYVYHPQLELGNVATDWAPAPEDTDDKIAGIKIGARNLIRNSDDLIFSAHNFTEGFLSNIVESQQVILAAQDAILGTTTVVTPGSATFTDLESELDNYLLKQQDILTKINELPGGDAE